MSTRIWRFLPLIFCPHRSHAGRCRPPFFCAFHALAIDNGGGRTGVSLLLFTTLLIKSVVHAFQRAIVGPQIEGVMNRTFRR